VTRFIILPIVLFIILSLVAVSSTQFVVLATTTTTTTTIDQVTPSTIPSTIPSKANSSNSSSGGGIAGTVSGTTPASKIRIVTSFYPIYEFAKQVGGNKVEVSNLIPVGVEPHDYEPTVQQILTAQSSDILVYNGAGLEPWIKKINAKFAVDTSQGLQLLQMSNEVNTRRGGGAPGEVVDPHIWLDPILAKHQVEKIRDALLRVDPMNKDYYNMNAQKFIGQLNSLDSSIRSQLSASKCPKKDFIVFHNAFSYFAKRYGLNQHSIHEGLTPEGEILPQRLQEIVQLSRNLGLNVIYSEDLVDPRLSNVIAGEIPNGKVLILSPIEGINQEEQKAGIGYLDKMNQDINNLKVGLDCKT
jgi:zinc transport system substrate-binding protein